MGVQSLVSEAGLLLAGSGGQQPKGKAFVVTATLTQPLRQPGTTYPPSQM